MSDIQTGSSGKVCQSLLKHFYQFPCKRASHLHLKYYICYSNKTLVKVFLKSYSDFIYSFMWTKLLLIGSCFLPTLYIELRSKKWPNFHFCHAIAEVQWRHHSVRGQMVDQTIVNHGVESRFFKILSHFGLNKYFQLKLHYLKLEKGGCVPLNPTLISVCAPEAVWVSLDKNIKWLVLIQTLIIS